MKINALVIAAALVIAPAAAMAQSAPAASEQKAPAAYSTAETTVGEILDDAAAKAVIDKYVPGFSSNDQVEMARGMTLRDVQQYAPTELSDEVLAKIDADFAKLPPKK